MSPEVPAGVDQNLVFWMKGFPGRNFLVGSSHSGAGRMEAYSEAEARSFSVSKYEIERMSEAAERWIQGFLAGSEPPPPIDVGAEDPFLDQWGAATREYRATG